jgi:hypothetical protein
MSEKEIEIGAPGVDTERIVAEIRAAVAKKMAEGVYTDARIARAERLNLANLRNEEQFLTFYLDCLREAVFVDISDFEITERRARFSGLLIALKRTIWKMLKFYTYRLWSQQNQVNGLLLAAMEGVQSSQREQIRKLEERVAQLERGNKPGGNA